jgi:hypothetical protein
MKNYIGKLTLTIVLLVSVSLPSFATTDISIGGTAWYIWWRPAWLVARTSTAILNPEHIVTRENASDFQTRSDIMGGPMLSLSFLDRWGISSVFVIGKFRYTADGPSTAIGFSIPDLKRITGIIYKKYERDVLKWDSDSSLSCAINQYIKIFAGFKAQGYSYKEIMTDVNLIGGPPFIYRKLEDDVKGFGPGLGIGLTVPLTHNFFLMMNVSGIALWFKEKIDINTSLITNNNINYAMILWEHKGDIFSYGGTGSMSLAYYIEKADITLALGGRYQLLYNNQKQKNWFFNDIAMNIVDGRFDHLYGVTFSAIYSFHIGKKAEPDPVN